MNLKVINEIRDELKTFKTVEEFDIYYSKHKDEMSAHTTQYLNRVYKIDTNDGEYRITKKNCKKVDGKITDGEIYLKKVKSKTSDDDLTSLRFTSIEASVESNKASINQLKIDVERLTQLVNDIKDKLNNVIQVINSQINS